MIKENNKTGCSAAASNVKVAVSLVQFVGYLNPRDHHMLLEFGGYLNPRDHYMLLVSIAVK